MSSLQLYKWLNILAMSFVVAVMLTGSVWLVYKLATATDVVVRGSSLVLYENRRDGFGLDVKRSLCTRHAVDVVIYRRLERVHKAHVRTYVLLDAGLVRLPKGCTTQEYEYRIPWRLKPGIYRYASNLAYPFLGVKESITPLKSFTFKVNAPGDVSPYSHGPDVKVR